MHGQYLLRDFRMRPRVCMPALEFQSLRASWRPYVCLSELTAFGRGRFK